MPFLSPNEQHQNSVPVLQTACCHPAVMVSQEQCYGRTFYRPMISGRETLLSTHAVLHETLKQTQLQFSTSNQPPPPRAEATHTSLSLTKTMSVTKFQLFFLFNFEEILHRSWGPKSKNTFVRGQNPMLPFHYYVPIFRPYNAFSMGKLKYCSNEARGLTVAVKSSNDVPREWLQAQSCKML